MRAHVFVLVDLFTAGGHQDHQTNLYEDPGNEVHRGTFGWFARPVPFTIAQCADGLKLEDVFFVRMCLLRSRCSSVCVCVCARASLTFVRVDVLMQGTYADWKSVIIYIRDIMARYLVQDSLYLKQYAKVLALIAAKSDDRKYVCLFKL